MRTHLSTLPFAACFAVMASLPCHAVVLASYNFEGAGDARLDSKDTDADSTASALSAGAGMGTVGNSTSTWAISGTVVGTPARGNHMFASSVAITGTGTTPGTEEAAVANNDYFEFTFNPDSSTWSLTSLELEFYSARTTSGTAQTSPTPEMTMFVRSSVDDFGMTLGSATNVGLWGDTGQAYTDADFVTLGINLASLAAYGEISAPVTFRIYMRDNFSNSTNSGWGIRMDNIELEGTMVPEPSAASLAVLGSLLLGCHRRRGARRTRPTAAG
ncbi:MAG: hypothetical protein EOP87_16620 [Verrucomicrobiaceae bacterium]|nr:MAG: hypothetical protein EOP87_16620 [Verrucomicrobiaceae bacterium]